MCAYPYGAAAGGRDSWIGQASFSASPASLAFLQTSSLLCLNRRPLDSTAPCAKNSVVSKSPDRATRMETRVGQLCHASVTMMQSSCVTAVLHRFLFAVIIRPSIVRTFILRVALISFYNKSYAVRGQRSRLLPTFPRVLDPHQLAKVVCRDLESRESGVGTPLEWCGTVAQVRVRMAISKQHTHEQRGACLCWADGSVPWRLKSGCKHDLACNLTLASQARSISASTDRFTTTEPQSIFCNPHVGPSRWPT